MLPGVTCVVPARLGSTRFFGKLLRPLLGKPVIVHALERAAEAGCFDHIVCLTDSEEIARTAAAHGFDFRLTGDAANGTERIARALPGLRGDLFVNLQGDEPAFPPEGLRALRDAIVAHPEWTHTLVHEEAPSEEDMRNGNRVKAVLDADGFITGFTRFAMGEPAEAHRLQLGAYAYSRAYLERYLAAPVSAAEIELSHEMLRDTSFAPLRAHFSEPGASVDVPEDLAGALRALNALRASEASVDFSIEPHPQEYPRLQGTAP